MAIAPSGVLPPGTPPHRHALGLPAGSIRALLALSVLALCWLLVLHPLPGKEGTAIHYRIPSVFVYLQMLMVLMLAHFFAAHGASIRAVPSSPSPLHLPRGSVRFLLLAGYLGLIAYLWYNQTEFELPPRTSFLLQLLLLMTGFFLGHILTGIVRRLSGGILPAAFQDVQAWIALLALLTLAIILVVQLLINPTLSLGERIDLPTVESVLAALVGFYFGSRSTPS
jgi:hypothetical protein